MEIQGYMYEHDAIYYEGPFDGLEASIVTNKEEPPSVVYRIIGEDLNLESKKALGQKLMDVFKQKNIPSDTKVAAYKIEGNPEEYADDDTVPYRFIETLTYKEYKIKY
jgi:hypothetical protein